MKYNIYCKTLIVACATLFLSGCIYAGGNPTKEIELAELTNPTPTTQPAPITQPAPTTQPTTTTGPTGPDVGPTGPEVGPGDGDVVGEGAGGEGAGDGDSGIVGETGNPQPEPEIVLPTPPTSGGGGGDGNTITTDGREAEKLLTPSIEAIEAATSRAYSLPGNTLKALFQVVESENVDENPGQVEVYVHHAEDDRDYLIYSTFSDQKYVFSNPNRGDDIVSDNKELRIRTQVLEHSALARVLIGTELDNEKASVDTTLFVPKAFTEPTNLPNKAEVQYNGQWHMAPLPFPHQNINFGAETGNFEMNVDFSKVGFNEGDHVFSGTAFHNGKPVGDFDTGAITLQGDFYDLRLRGRPGTTLSGLEVGHIKGTFAGANAEEIVGAGSGDIGFIRTLVGIHGNKQD